MNPDTAAIALAIIQELDRTPADTLKAKRLEYLLTVLGVRD